MIQLDLSFWARAAAAWGAPSSPAEVEAIQAAMKEGVGRDVAVLAARGTLAAIPSAKDAILMDDDEEDEDE